MDRIEIVKKAVKILNETKGTNFKVENFRADRHDVTCDCTWDSGYKQPLNWSSDWFAEYENVESVLPISSKTADKIKEEPNTEHKAIMRIMAWLWENRDM